MQVSPINLPNLIRGNISKISTKKNAVVLSTLGLAAALPAKSFLDRTKNDKLDLSGHWETHQPMDSSDWHYQKWVEDAPQQYIPGSGCPEDN